MSISSVDRNAYSQGQQSIIKKRGGNDKRQFEMKLYSMCIFAQWSSWLNGGRDYGTN